MKKVFYSLMLLLGISMSIVSCSEKEPDTIPVAGVSLDKTSIEVVEGDSFSLTPTITPNDATNKRVIWSSSNESVATVNNGSVTTHKAGTVTITVKTEDGNRTATCSVNVKEKTIPVTGVSLDKTSLEMVEGDILTLIATISPDNATNKNVVWISNNEAVASVINGTISANKEGEATISAKAGNESVSCKVVVKKSIIEVENDTYEIYEDGGTIEVKVSSNTNYVVIIDDNSKKWISQKQSTGNTLVFSISSCDVSTERTGYIVLLGKYTSCGISITQLSKKATQPIVFDDKIVKRVCVSYFDSNGDGEVSYNEVSKLKTIKTPFFGDYSQGVTSFNELQFFTSLESIPMDAFKDCSYLKSIVIPESVQSIKDRAFYDCKSLDTIILPNSLSSIGYSAFYGCTNLNIDLPESCTTIGRYAFCYSGLTHITIPEGTTEIERSAFMECKNLESVYLPSSITRINDAAFGYCFSLSHVNLPESLTYLGQEAFTQTSITEVQIPSNLVSIPRLCFAGSAIKELIIPSNIVSLQSDSFAACKNLRKVTINNPDIIFDGNPFNTEIGSNIESFYGPLASKDNRCLIKNDVLIALAPYGIKEYTIPNGVKAIGVHAGNGMTTIEKITLPNSVESIGDGAFHSSSALKIIVFPESLKQIGVSAFEGCNSLKEISLPDSVTKVRSNAFANCLLDKLTVGKIVEFDNNIGYSCLVVDVKTAIMRGKTPPKICPFNIETLYVPKGTKTVYESSLWKSSYTKSIVEYNVN